jgi:hypothetical protein
MPELGNSKLSGLYGTYTEMIFDENGEPDYYQLTNEQSIYATTEVSFNNMIDMGGDNTDPDIDPKYKCKCEPCSNLISTGDYCDDCSKFIECENCKKEICKTHQTHDCKYPQTIYIKDLDQSTNKWGNWNEYRLAKDKYGITQYVAVGGGGAESLILTNIAWLNYDKNKNPVSVKEEKECWYRKDRMSETLFGKYDTTTITETVYGYNESINEYEEFYDGTYVTGTGEELFKVSLSNK